MKPDVWSKVWYVVVLLSIVAMLPIIDEHNQTSGGKEDTLSWYVTKVTILILL